ncbi:diguanylate cyclase [Halomonas sp. ANAO-440]|uniref:sensor domain-containing diguanylate cyclase n=1 Tax=Halomonas sp. ANAO-440 TaxID=2861360 RepID=UPI001CAA5F22|nr:7TM diverse intracellular signaling domain-containing protein [Halomonas sp. ANAO-440]MBZ0331198.1 diguanylate cyclase [Halomonas sp. ANAO-440]
MLLPAVAVAAQPERISLGTATEWAIDDGAAYTSLNELLENEDRLDWKASEDAGLAFGFTTQPYWYRFSVGPVDSTMSHRFLHISEPLLNELDIYVLHGDRLQARFALGNDHPFHARPVEHHQFVVPVSLSEEETTRFYVRVRTSGSMHFEPVLWQAQAFAEHARQEAIISGLYYGIMLAMFFYNLFLYFVVRDRSYLYYIGFVAAFTLFIGSLYGDTYQYLWPSAVAWNEVSVTFTVAVTGVMVLLFSSTFLRLRQLWPAMYRFFMALLVISLLLSGLSFVIDYSLSIRLNSLQGMLIMVTMLTVGFWMWARGHSHARYFALAWFAVVVGTSALALNRWGVLPGNALFANGARIGAVLEVLLLSFALGDRINQERAARFQAQQEVLASSRRVQEAQKALLAAKETANRELERRVNERTRELETALQKLEVMNRQLENTSNTDQLTGLHNRHFFVEKFHKEYQRAFRHREPISVLLMDIDHFKYFNDTHGHLAGDECLKEVAKAISGLISRPGDIVARFGGEEFIMVLAGTGMEGARVVAERVRASVAGLVLELGGHSVQVTTSVGVATLVPDSVQASESLIQAADESLYAAKAQGRNRVCCYPLSVN